MKKSTIKLLFKMINVHTIYFTLFFTFISKVGFSQTTQFIQDFNQPLLLNPAYAGTIEKSRFILNTHRQWPQFSSGRTVRFDSHSVSYDHFFQNSKIAIAGLVNHDEAGESNLQSNTVGFIGAYELSVSNTDLRVRFSLQTDYAMMDVNFSGLIFEDQILTQNATSQELFANSGDKVNYFDISFGTLISNSNFWAGVALHHLNKPNISLIDQRTILPTKLTIHGGVRFLLGDSKIWLVDTKSDGNPNNSRLPTSSANPKKQLRFYTIYQKLGSADQLSFGTTFKYIVSKNVKYSFDDSENEISMYSFNVGLVYNGISSTGNFSINQSVIDPFVFNLGFNFVNFPISSIGYSYGLPFLSDLETSTGGSHTLSLRFLFGHATKDNYPVIYNWKKHRASLPIMDAP